MTVIEKIKKNIVILEDDNSKRIGEGKGRVGRLKVSSKPRIKPTSVWEEECF